MPTDVIRTNSDMTDLSDLQPLAKRINAASDELNQALQTIQDKLNALAIGVEVWLDDPISESAWRQIRDRDNEPLTREYDADELGYGRLGDGWALLTRRRRFVEEPDAFGHLAQIAYDDTGETKPLLRAARAVRIKAVDRIPDLIEKLQRAAQEAVESVERAKRIAESLK